ncbi:MAG: transporter [Planctomycetes bacterium]|nr:transporter [Planctomycetota bacterium]
MQRLSLLAVLMACSSTASAQLVTENAGTTSPETPVARFLIRTSVAQRVVEHAAVAELHYGLRNDIEATLALPYVVKDIQVGEERDQTEGLGDVSLGLKINVHKLDGVMSSSRVALFGGVEAPTGDHHAELDGASEPYARKLQIGSGGWDSWLGAAVTVIEDRHRFALDVAGRWNGGHDGVRPGPSARVDAAYWFRLFPAKFEPGAAGAELRLVLDVSVVKRWRTRGGAGDDSGTTVWVAPGVQFYATTSVLFEGNIAFPVYDSVDDEYGDQRFTAFVAVKFLF